MKSQNNTSAFQIVAVVLSLFYIFLRIAGGFGIHRWIMLVGAALLIAGILSAKTRFSLLGVLLIIVRNILYVCSSLPYISWELQDGRILYFAWAYVWPIVMWILFAIALIKRDKALTLCCIAAAAGSGLALMSYGINPMYRIADILLCIAIALLGYALQNGMQSVFISRPVETSKKASNQYENLIKLKDLLDSGAITQEEFEQKKKELLNQ